MSDFFEARSLTSETQKKLAAEIESRIAARLEDGLLTERDIREIEQMRLRPLPDIQDVQNVYENHLFREKPE
jgi:hypothetical protein